MKKTTPIFGLIFLLGLLLFTNISLFGQKINAADVPSDVAQSFEFEHPSAKISSWFVENDNFVVSFKEDGMSGKAYIKNDGNWIMSVFPIPKGELPSAITEYAKKNYQYPVITFSALQSSPKEQMHYYVELKSEGMQGLSRLTFSNMGTLMSREDPDTFVDETETADEEKAAVTPREKQKRDYNEEVAATDSKKKQESASLHASDGEELDASEVSGVLTKSLAKKVQNPSELSWYKIDSLYVAKCIYREQKHDLFFLENGSWVNTYFGAGEIAVTSVIQKHLNSFYNGWRFKAVVKEARADKQDKTLVAIYEKDNYKNKLVTTVIFDKSGKFVRSFDPEQDTDNKNSAKEPGLDKYYEKLSLSADEEATNGVPTQVLNAFQVKYPRITNPQWEQDDEGSYMAIYMGIKGKEICVIGQSGTILETQNIGNMEFLPSTIQSYLKKNASGFKVDEYYAVKNLLEKQNYYKVNVSNKKTKEKATLWFNTSGKIIER